MDATFDQCCDFGVSRAYHESCTNYDFNVISKDISEKLHQICRMNIDLCCNQKVQEMDCKAGIQHAKAGKSCRDASEMFQVT